MVNDALPHIEEEVPLTSIRLYLLNNVNHRKGNLLETMAAAAADFKAEPDLASLLDHLDRPEVLRAFHHGLEINGHTEVAASWSVLCKWNAATCQMMLKQTKKRYANGNCRPL